MVAKKIWDMKENKSPGMDWIPPNLLLKIVEQISIPQHYRLQQCSICHQRRE